MNNRENIQAQIKEFIAHYPFEQKIQIWKEKSAEFRDIWNGRLLKGKANISDFDRIVYLIDRNARGRSKDDEVVAKTGIRYGIWYRCFNDLNSNQTLKSFLNDAFLAQEYEEVAAILDKLHNENRSNKNGLTGKSANIINSLLCINSPEKYIHSVSLRHRIEIILYLEFADPDEYEGCSYGESIINSNSAILNGMSDLFSGFSNSIAGYEYIFPRMYSEFIYKDLKYEIWSNNSSDFEEGGAEETDLESQKFFLEKYLENFLYSNWESTQLGQQYSLIFEDGEPISLQYKTDIGRIDLLVIDKKTSDYLVIELKKGQTSDETIGQVTRYMGWVRENLATKSKVRGLIIADGFDEKIQYSRSLLPDIELMTYHIDFKLKKV